MQDGESQLTLLDGRAGSGMSSAQPAAIGDSQGEQHAAERLAEEQADAVSGRLKDEADMAEGLGEASQGRGRGWRGWRC